jgi:regulatory protein YycI of two-component signal transduction system YycFG
MLEEVKLGQTYSNEDVRVEHVDQDHLRIYNLLEGRATEGGKRVTQKVREFREKNSELIASPLTVTRQQWERLKSMPQNSLKSVFPTSDAKEDAYWVIGSDVFGKVAPEEFYTTNDRWVELTQFFKEL